MWAASLMPLMAAFKDTAQGGTSAPVSRIPPTVVANGLIRII